MLRRVESLALWTLATCAAASFAHAVVLGTGLAIVISLAFVLTAGTLLFLHHHSPED